MAERNAAERIVDVLELLVDYPEGVPLSEISRQLSLPKSATHRLLATLVGRAWVERPQGREEYRLGLKLPAMGFRYVSQRGRLDICQPILDRLAADTGELIRMTLADERGLTWVTKAQGSRFGLRYDPDMGAAVRMHVTASGRAWLATLPAEKAHALVLAQGFEVPERFGRQTVRTVEELEQELDRTRKRGYGLTIEEIEAGTAAVAMALDGGAGKTSPGTVSVLGPVMRMSPLALEKIVPRLAAAIHELNELWPIIELHGNPAQP